MKENRAGYADARDRVQWLPAYVYTASGDQKRDELVKHDILVECNFVDQRQIAWPAYVKRSKYTTSTCAGWHQTQTILCVTRGQSRVGP